MGDRVASKSAVVTGAGSGIGRAITLRLAAEGADVLAVDVNGSEEDTARFAGSRVAGFRCDIADSEQVANLAAYVGQRFGGLDILCNNAGIGGPIMPLHDYPLDDFDRVHSVNVRGAFMVLQMGLRLMLSRGTGAVVNTASLGGFRATPGACAYIISKGAVVMMTRQAALEYASAGIRVNAICPGVIATPILDGAPEEMLSMLRAQVPQGRLGTAEEVASLALFLASDEASHVTGQCYVVDGGRSAG